jgi:hypothetical protein
MCYSAEISAATAGFVGVIAWHLWKRGRRQDRPIALILVVISLMQVLEFGLWTNLDCSTMIHKILSAFISPLVFVQPVLLNWIVASFDAGIFSPDTYTKAMLPTGFVFLASIVQAIQNYGACTRVGAGGHLEWATIPKPLPLGDFGKLSKVIYYAGMAFPIATLKNTAFGLTYTAISVISVFMLKEASTRSWPSVWCNFVNFLAVLALLL